jgi:tetratricopeptide (TPR) repeat protein
MRLLLLIILLVGYLAVIGPFTSYMRDKPIVEKLGYVPRPAVLRAITADQQQTMAAWLIMKVLFYYGSLVEAAQNEIILPPDYQAIQKNLETAVELDPYNMDAYYFAQAILVWDAGRIAEVNRMLVHGMAYRTRDWSLPFYAGFNSAYFQNDYQQAAKYYKRAAELSGFGIFIRLAGRYLYETSQTDQAIAYLTVMEKNARKDSIRQSFQIRLQALKEVQRVEIALKRYLDSHDQPPETLHALVESGDLGSDPVDPYGGTFYIDEAGRVRTTSKFAFSTQK